MAGFWRASGRSLGERRGVSPTWKLQMREGLPRRAYAPTLAKTIACKSGLIVLRRPCDKLTRAFLVRLLGVSHAAPVSPRLLAHRRRTRCRRGPYSIHA